MSGLREKKKAESKEKILRAAKEILTAKGYSDTTMEEIAAKADIGVGTLYNYYSSKAEIFLSVMSGELAQEAAAGPFHSNPTGDAAEIIIVYLKKTFKGIKLFGKRIWREIFSAMFSDSKPGNFIFRGVLDLDLKFIEKTERLLDSMKQSGTLPQTFKSAEAAYAIYSIIITQTLLYTYNDDITAEAFENNVIRQIIFLFEGKCDKK